MTEKIGMEDGFVNQILVWGFCKHKLVVFVELLEEHPLQNMSEMEQVLQGNKVGGGSGGGRGH